MFALAGVDAQLKLGGCQNYGPFLGTLNIRWRIIMGIQKGTIILTTTQLSFEESRSPGAPWLQIASTLDPKGV